MGYFEIVQVEFILEQAQINEEIGIIEKVYRSIKSIKNNKNLVLNYLIIN